MKFIEVVVLTTGMVYLLCLRIASVQGQVKGVSAKPTAATLLQKIILKCYIICKLYNK